MYPEIVSEDNKLIYHGTPLTYNDALGYCRRQNASLVLVDSKAVKVALESLLISKNSGTAQPWKELLWTNVLTSVGGNKCSTAPRLMAFDSLNKYIKDDMTYLNTTTQWRTAGSNEKHNFVCSKGWYLIIKHAARVEVSQVSSLSRALVAYCVRCAALYCNVECAVVHFAVHDAGVALSVCLIAQLWLVGF